MEGRGKLGEILDQFQIKRNSFFQNHRITGISKLEDANEAGSKTSSKCTLILTEGDSAKSLAVKGLSVIGRNRYGVFPLRGKLLNVRDADRKKVAENQEITQIKQIIGLQHGQKYKSVDGLRYGSVMIMTDQVRLNSRLGESSVFMVLKS
jgi:DNA topoisomerase II